MQSLVLSWHIICCLLCVVAILLVKPAKATPPLKIQARAYIRAPSHLQELESLELQFVKNLTRLKNGKNIIPQIQLYLNEFYQGSGLTSINVVNEIQETQSWKNPICGYRLVGRISRLLRDLVFAEGFNTTFNTQSIVDYLDHHGWPVKSDVDDSINAILRIQQVYNLDPEELSNGWVFTAKTPCTLTSQHCLEIAKIGVETEYYALAIEWLELAKKKVVLDEKIDPDLIGEALWFAIEEHNKALNKDPMAMKVFDRKLTHAPQNSQTAEKMRNLAYKHYKGSKHIKAAEVNYWSLCSGENHQTEQEKANLFCWLETSAHPAFTISPRKIEYLTRNPDAVQVYDVLTPTEREWIKSEAKPFLKASGVVKGNNGSRYLDSNRRSTSHIYFSDEVNESPRSLALSRKIEQITGLPVVGDASVEKLQIATSSFGGHHMPHFDGFANWEHPANKDDIFATFSIYLNNVELGGGTAFTAWGFAAKPIAGSAIFWYTKLAEDDSYHGGCPVLLGEKWLATMWLRFKDQSLVRKWNQKRFSKNHKICRKMN